MSPSGHAISQEADNLTCSACSSGMAFDPASQFVNCVSCGLGRPPGIGDGKTNAISKRCRKCGARALGTAQVLAGPCIFCGASMVRGRGGDLSWPNAVIPFQLAQAEAETRLNRWLAEMPSPPHRISEYGEADRPLTSAYLPFYRFTHRSAEIEDVTARSACPQLGKFIGRGDALEMVWRKLPFRPFHADFVAGHVVTLPQISMNDAIRDEVDRPTAPTDIVSSKSVSRSKPGQWELQGCLRVLAPVWLGSYRWDNRRYAVAIDGVTGEVLGARPEDGLGDVRGISTFVEWTMYGTYALAMGTIAAFTIAWLLGWI